MNNSTSELATVPIANEPQVHHSTGHAPPVFDSLVTVRGPCLVAFDVNGGGGEGALALLGRNATFLDSCLVITNMKVGPDVTKTKKNSPERQQEGAISPQSYI